MRCLFFLKDLISWENTNSEHAISDKIACLTIPIGQKFVRFFWIKYSWKFDVPVHSSWSHPFYCLHFYRIILKFVILFKLYNFCFIQIIKRYYWYRVWSSLNWTKKCFCLILLLKFLISDVSLYLLHSFFGNYSLRILLINLYRYLTEQLSFFRKFLFLQLLS